MKRTRHDSVLLSHGAGGRLTHELIATLFRKRFSNPALDALDDAAELAVPAGEGCRIAFTTDSFVVDPLFFPGGDIGKLAVCGTVNDLAMKGARPLGLSLAAVIEEGFPIGSLKAVTLSAARAAREAGVPVVTGDTKVVERGKADGLFLNASGVGIIDRGTDISGSNARPGDCVLLSGTLGDHGIAVLAARNDFSFRVKLKSDCAPLNRLTDRILAAAASPGMVRVLRDPTRGGLATTLNEIAASSRAGIVIDDESVPVRKEVRAACDLLGLDPLYVANEGKLVCIASAEAAEAMLAAMRDDPRGRDARIIGRVTGEHDGVWLKTRVGGLRPLPMLEGEQMPRIC